MRSYETLYIKNDCEVIHRLDGGSGLVEIWKWTYKPDGSQRAEFIAICDTLEDAKKAINGGNKNE